MSGKKYLYIILILLIFSSIVYALETEIIKVSSLEKKVKEFEIKRDIFSPSSMIPPSTQEMLERTPPPPPPKKEEVDERSREEQVQAEIIGSVSFEGYVLKYNKNHALLSVNGEFFVAGVDDVILDKIKIVKIEKEMVAVEVETRIIEIKLKGDDDENQQVYK